MRPKPLHGDASIAGTEVSAFVRLLGGNREVLALTTCPADTGALTEHQISVVDVASKRSRAMAEVPGGRPVVERRLRPMLPVSYPDCLFDGLWLRLGHTDPEWSNLRHYARTLAPGGVMSLACDSARSLPGDLPRRLQELGFHVVAPPEVGSDAWNAVLAVKQSDGTDGNDDCALCPELRFRLNRLENLPGATGVLWGDGDFLVMPDLAPLDEGHLLIVTVRHKLAMGACSEDVLFRLEEQLQRVTHLFRSAYGTRALFFEHGPASPGEAGSCIDHAHVHCLPARAGVVEGLRREGIVFEPTSLVDLNRLHASGKSYLFLQDAGERRRCSTGVEKLPNQMMRRAYSQMSGNTDWRWQTLYMRAVSRERFMATLNRLLPAVDGILADPR